MISAMGKSEVNIRRMERSDIEAVLTLDRKIGGGESSISFKDMVATNPGGPLDFSFVAEIEHQLLGFMLAQLAYLYIPFTEVCVIQAIATDPDYQRRGIGGKLVNALLSRCHSEGINTIRALVEDRNTELRRFIERLGFHHSNIINYDKTFSS